MSEKQAALLNICKALTDISFTLLASAGSAIAGMTGNYLWAALCASGTVLPAAMLASFENLKSSETTLKESDSQFEIAMPSWWKSDAISWQNVCTEVIDHFPKI